MGKRLKRADVPEFVWRRLRAMLEYNVARAWCICGSPDNKLIHISVGTFEAYPGGYYKVAYNAQCICRRCAKQILVFIAQTRNSTTHEVINGSTFDALSDMVYDA